MNIKLTEMKNTSPAKPKYEETLDRLAKFLAQTKTHTVTIE